MKQRVSPLLLTAFLVAVALSAQSPPPESITAAFTWQQAQFGNLQLYAANVCNAGPMNSTVQTYRDVWPAAKAVNLQLQTPTAILEVQKSLEKSDWPKWILWGAAGGCAITAGVTGGGAVSNDPKTGVGKAVAYGAAGCAIGLPILAERLVNTPGGKPAPAPASEMLPPVFVLAAGDCRQGLVYAIAPFQTKVLP